MVITSSKNFNSFLGPTFKMTEKPSSVQDGKKPGKVKISIQADGIKMTTVDVFSDTTELSPHEEEQLSCPECHINLGKDYSIIWIS